MTLLLFWAALQSTGGDVAGRVNEDVITWAEVDKRLPSPRPVEGLDQLRQALLKQLIEERIFVQEAEKLKIKIEGRDIDEQLGSDIARVGGDEKFRQFLLTNNMTLKEYRQHLRTQMLVTQVIQYKYQEWIPPDERARQPDSVVPAINEIITPEEIRQEYVRSKDAKFNARRDARVGVLMLDYADEATKAERMRLAESLRRKIAAGTDFMAMAVLYTDGPRTEETLVQTITPTTSYGEEVARLVFNGMKPGEISPIVDQRGFLYLFYLQALNVRDPMSLGDATSIIRASLIFERRNQNRQRLLEALIDHAYVEPASLFKRRETASGGGR